MTECSRRRFLELALGASAASTLPLAAFANPVPHLEVLAAPNGASLILARLLGEGGLLEALPGANFRLWRAPDELRASLVSGRTRLFTTPSHVPANLANRGMPIRLLCILSMGHLSIVTADETIQSFADLKGKSILGFFRNDMPDLTFRAVVKLEGLDPDRDMTLTYVQTPMEAAHMLAAGKVETAILSEPPATGSIFMASQAGRTLRRAISLQDVWQKHRGSKIPMAGIAVHQGLLDECPELVPALKAGLPRARDWIFANRDAAGELAGKMLGARPQVFAKALDHFNMDVMPARAVKTELEAFYSAILDISPDSLGGRLPDDDFYLDL